jgi:hypothetical protein
VGVFHLTAINYISGRLQEDIGLKEYFFICKRERQEKTGVVSKEGFLHLSVDMISV